jgi:hypothetical protein
VCRALDGVRVDVSDGTKLAHRTALRHALLAFSKRRVDDIVAQDVADLVAHLHADGAKRDSIRKVVGAAAMVFDLRASRRPRVVKLPHGDTEPALAARQGGRLHPRPARRT